MPSGTSDAPAPRTTTGAPALVPPRTPAPPTRGQARAEALRAELRPLAPGERPPALIVASAVAGVLAVAVLVGALTIHDLSRRGGSLPGAIVLAAVLGAGSWGMWNRRYGAVLGFEALLAFQILVTSIALVVASTVYAALLCVASIGLGGWLFWKLVRVMARLQASRSSGSSPTT